MVQASELFTLARDLAHLKVLSVYIDNRVADPAKRYVWRADLASRLRNAREKIADAAERAQFDRAAGFLEEPVPQPGGMWAAPGWGGVHDGQPCRGHRRIAGTRRDARAWQEGAVITPCLRALKHECPVIVALVQSRAARLYRYVHGALESLDVMQAPAFEKRLRRIVSCISRSPKALMSDLVRRRWRAARRRRRRCGRPIAVLHRRARQQLSGVRPLGYAIRAMCIVK